MFYLAIVLTACTGESPDSATPSETIETTGRLVMSFDMDPALIDTMKPEEPTGTCWGEILSPEDVGKTGPKKGANPLDQFAISVDLRPSGKATDPLIISNDLEPGPVTIVAFLDTDGNIDS